MDGRVRREGVGHRGQRGYRAKILKRRIDDRRGVCSGLEPGDCREVEHEMSEYILLYNAEKGKKEYPKLYDVDRGLEV